MNRVCVNRHSGKDCRKPVAMDGEPYHYKFHDKHSIIQGIRPCALDPGTNLYGTDLHLPEGCQAG